MMTMISSERPGVLLTAMECVIAVTATDLLNRFDPPTAMDWTVDMLTAMM